MPITPLPPIPLKAKLQTKDGLLSAPWAQWFREAFTRMGGHNAITNADFTDNSAAIAALETTVSGHTTTLSTHTTQIAALTGIIEGLQLEPVA